MSMKGKFTNLKIKCRVKCIQLFYCIKREVLRLCNNVIKGVNKIQLPMIILFTILVLILIVFYILNPDWAVVGEKRILAFYYKLELFGVLLTAVSLIAAAITILIAIQKPKLKIYFYNDHGSDLIPKKKEIELGIDKSGNIGYQACVPSKWNMNLINIGRKTAEKIKIKISFDNIYFDISLAEKGYDLEGFQYGLGVFNVISFELINLLRQGEQVVLPDLPFYKTECDSDELRKRGYTYLRIKIFSGNHEPISLKYKVIISDYDLDSFGYMETNKEINDEFEFKNNFYQWYIDNHNITKDSNDLYYYYYREINPYQIKRYANVTESKILYQYYEDKDVEKMLFWGRIYYRAIGMELQDIEAMLQTEMMKISVKKTIKQNGMMSII